MIAVLSNLLQAATGKGAYSVTVPPMDGALRPNSALDALPLVQAIADVDNLATLHDQLLYSSGRSLLTCRMDGTGMRKVTDFEAPVSALATREDGVVAVALDDGSLVLTDLQGSRLRRLKCIEGAGAGSVTALAFDPSGSIYGCVGSSVHRASAWKRDLMEKGITGTLWRIHPQDLSAIQLARGLAFPNGIAFDRDGVPLVSEAWRHRIVSVSGNGRMRACVDDLPGYPGRLCPAAGGGFWLSVFAPRSQIVEFVLREDDYRRRMMREVPEDYWLAPSLRSGKNHLEPLQGGAIRQLGIHKPWAPSFSYGLLVRLDPQCQPVDSWHSRADGDRHGVTSSVEHAGRILVACRGGGVILHTCSTRGAEA